MSKNLPGLEWLADEESAARDAVYANDSDRVRDIRARQSAQRRANQERITGSALNDRDAAWLFQNAVIIDIPNA